MGARSQPGRNAADECPLAPEVFLKVLLICVERSCSLPREVHGKPSVMRGTEAANLCLQYGVQCSLEQMLEDGFYHADREPLC